MISTLLLPLALSVAQATEGEVRVPAATTAVGRSGPVATADTWPSWRGDPAQTGRSPAALDVAGLTARWRASTGAEVVAAPVVDAARVYVGSKDGTIYAFGRQDGAVAWKVSTDASVEAPALLAGGLVVVGSRDGKLRALVADSGQERWAVDLQAEITGAAVWTPPHGDAGPGVLIGGYDGRVHHLDLATGARRWTFETGSYIYGSGAVADGLAVIGGCDGFVHTLRLSDGTEVAKLPVEAYVGASVAWSGPRAFVGHFGHQIVAFDPRTGTQAWSHRERTFPYLSSPAVLPGTVVVLGGRDRTLHALDPASGEPMWWFGAKGKIDSSPVLVGGRVVVGSADGHLYVVDADTGEAVRDIDLGAPVNSSPAVAGGWVWIGTDDGTVHAWGPAPKPATGAK